MADERQQFQGNRPQGAKASHGHGHGGEIEKKEDWDDLVTRAV